MPALFSRGSWVWCRLRIGELCASWLRSEIEEDWGEAAFDRKCIHSSPHHDSDLLPTLGYL